jgi:hypothetical protein
MTPALPTSCTASPATTSCTACEATTCCSARAGRRPHRRLRRRLISGGTGDDGVMATTADPHQSQLRPGRAALRRGWTTGTTTRRRTATSPTTHLHARQDPVRDINAAAI